MSNNGLSWKLKAAGRHWQIEVPPRELLGHGHPLREILHVNDLGEACIFSLEHWSPVENGPLSFLRGHWLGPQQPRAAGEAIQ